jgi:lipopolysaccharide biosynthesis glycosyltransferase
MAQEIPIAFCFDANFANYAAVATFSAFTNSKTKLKVYWIIPSEAESATIPIKEILSQKGVDISIQVVEVSWFNEWKVQGHIKKATYQRLLIPNVLSLPKIIYLDCDLIVQADLSELFEMKMGNKEVGGVYDPAGEKLSLMPKQKGDKYINAGVMIMNLESLRKNHFLEKCFKIYTLFTNEITFNDQCIINKYSEGQKLLIDSLWNYCFFICHNMTLSPKAALKKLPKAKILHFVGPIKPWSENCPPHLSDCWWSYADLLNLPSLERKVYTTPVVIKIKRGLVRRVTDSINKRILKIKGLVQRISGR